MFSRITNVRHTTDYRLMLTFTDGTNAELDFRERIVGRGGMFAPLQDVEYFGMVRVNAEAGTIEWPNGVDLCPDVLYAAATGASAAPVK
ncbi:MAG: DUF2442 domain-containing protein [Pirellulales bacterium]